MVNNSSNTSNNYRWLGLVGIILLIASNWLNGIFGISIIDPIARLLFLAFSIKYWLIHKDSFSIILIICVFIMLLLSLGNLTQAYVSPNSF